MDKYCQVEGQQGDKYCQAEAQQEDKYCQVEAHKEDKYCQVEAHKEGKYHLLVQELDLIPLQEVFKAQMEVDLLVQVPQGRSNLVHNQLLNHQLGLDQKILASQVFHLVLMPHLQGPVLQVKGVMAAGRQGTLL